jgi:hypothetical protein
LIEGWMGAQARARMLADQARMASESRWLRLGRKLGVGPKLTG